MAEGRVKHQIKGEVQGKLGEAHTRERAATNNIRLRGCIQPSIYT